MPKTIQQIMGLFTHFKRTPAVPRDEELKLLLQPDELELPSNSEVCLDILPAGTSLIKNQFEYASPPLFNSHGLKIANEKVRFYQRKDEDLAKYWQKISEDEKEKAYVNALVNKAKDISDEKISKKIKPYLLANTVPKLANAKIDEPVPLSVSPDRSKKRSF